MCSCLIVFLVRLLLGSLSFSCFNSHFLPNWMPNIASEFGIPKTVAVRVRKQIYTNCMNSLLSHVVFHQGTNNENQSMANCYIESGCLGTIFFMFCCCWSGYSNAVGNRIFRWLPELRITLEFGGRWTELGFWQRTFYSALTNACHNECLLCYIMRTFGHNKHLIL